MEVMASLPTASIPASTASWGFISPSGPEAEAVREDRHLAFQRLSSLGGEKQAGLGHH